MQGEKKSLPLNATIAELNYQNLYPDLKVTTFFYTYS